MSGGYGGGGSNSTLGQAYPGKMGAQQPNAWAGGGGGGYSLTGAGERGRFGGVAPPTMDYGGVGQQPGAGLDPLEMQRPFDRQMPIGASIDPLEMQKPMRGPDAGIGGGMMPDAGIGQGLLGGGSRGQVPFYRWDQDMARLGAQPGGGLAPQPAPQPIKQPGASIDHMANFQKLYQEDPRLANEYRLRSGDTIGWWQNNGQNQALQNLFGGNQGAMNSWVNGTSPQSSNAAPLTMAEMARLNQMAGIRGPSWVK